MGGRDWDDEFKERNLGEKFGKLSSRERKYGISKLGRHWREIKRERERGHLNGGRVTWERHVWEDKKKLGKGVKRNKGETLRDEIGENDKQKKSQEA